MKYEYARLVRTVIHKKLWIRQVVHALTVAPSGLIHALTVAVSRINGRAPNKYLYAPVIKSPVVGAAPTGDKSATCHPNGWHLLPTFTGDRAGRTSRR